MDTEFNRKYSNFSIATYTNWYILKQLNITHSMINADQRNKKEHDIGLLSGM